MQLSLLAAAADVAAIALAFFLASFLKPIGNNWYAILSIALPLYVGTALNTGAYAIEALRRSSLSVSRVIMSLLFVFGMLFLISYFFRVEQSISRFALVATMIMSTLFVVLVRQMIASAIKRRFADRIYAEMMLVDRVRIATPDHMITVDAAQIKLTPDLRDPTMLNRFAELVRRCDRVVVACPAEARQSWSMMLKGASIRGEVIVEAVAEMGAIGFGSVEEHATLTVSSGPLDFSQQLTKRCFDLALCVPALIALGPVLLMTALAIKLDSRGPVFFRQRRVGRRNAFFDILKFRSMYVDMGDVDGNVSTRRHDARITRVGRFIRRTSIDELPQLLNVLGGSMSLVGPRPHALGSLAGEDLFWDIDQRYWHRHVLKPGITGLAQVRGLRGATNHRDDLTRRLQADLEYTADWSIWRDLAILLSTVKVVVHENTY